MPVSAPPTTGGLGVSTLVAPTATNRSLSFSRGVDFFRCGTASSMMPPIKSPRRPKRGANPGETEILANCSPAPERASPLEITITEQVAIMVVDRHDARVRRAGRAFAVYDAG